MPHDDLRNDHNCIAAPLAIEICTPTWADSERLEIIRWQAGLVVDIDPVIVHPETCPVGEDFTREYDRAEACEATLGETTLALEEATSSLEAVTAENARMVEFIGQNVEDLRACRTQLHEAGIPFAPQAAGIGILALLALVVLWRRS